MNKLTYKRLGRSNMHALADRPSHIHSHNIANRLKGVFSVAVNWDGKFLRVTYS